MEANKVSKKLLNRLPLYLNHLKSMPEHSENISATALAKALGLPSVRIDTHHGNRPMQRALEKEGFQPCGDIILVGGPEDGDPRLAFERLL